MITRILIFVLLFSISITSFSEANPNNKDLKRSITVVQTWVNSLYGKTENQLKKAFPNQKPTRSTWMYKNKKELVLTYNYHNTKVGIYFLGTQVISITMRIVSQ